MSAVDPLAQLPFDLSLPRMSRIAFALGAVGTAAALFMAGPRDALGFLIGAGLSIMTVRSWFKLARGLGADGGLPGGGAAVFLVLRYVLIAGAVYATIKFLGSAPAALISGLLVSFAAVVIELLFALSAPKVSK
jgi:hypothetical protein